MSTRLAGRARRSTLALFTGAALAALLSVTAAGAAPPAGPADSRAGGATAAAVDVYMQDTTADVGLEPHALNPLWQSPDIKVCHTAIECATSQNPIVGQRNYIFVKLRNPGPYGDSVMEEGTIEVYRTTPGGGAAWPGAWTQIAWTAVPAYPGVTSVTLPWDGVPGPGHFCLLARWVSPNDPMTIEGPDIGVNTRHNNNIAWRNVDSVAVTAGGQAQIRPFAIGNTLTRAARSSVVFGQTGTAFQAAGGRLVVDLGPTLFERWAKGGKAGKGVREVGRTQVEIVDIGQASLDNLELNPGERAAFSLAFTAATPTREKVSVSVTQVGPDTTGAARADLGGVRYDITVAQRAG